MQDKITTVLFVLGYLFEQEFDLNNIFELMPCLPVKNYVHKRSMDYFGVPGSIVSYTYINRSRGIRTKTIRNQLTLDYQNETKNVHVKISRFKFLVTGVKGYEMGHDTVINILEFFDQVNAEWTPFYSLTKVLRKELITWVLDNLKHKKKILMFDSNRYQERINNLPEKFKDYINIIHLLSSFTYEISTYKEYVKKMKLVNACKAKGENLFYDKNNFKFKYYINYNCIYMYKFNCELPIQSLTLRFQDLGINSEYCSETSPKDMKITIPLRNKEIQKSYKEERKCKPSLNTLCFRFIITSNGKITLYCATEREHALNCFSKIHKIIKEYLKSIQN